MICIIPSSSHSGPDRQHSRDTYLTGDRQGLILVPHSFLYLPRVISAGLRGRVSLSTAGLSGQGLFLSPAGLKGVGLTLNPAQLRGEGPSLTLAGLMEVGLSLKPAGLR